MLNEIKTICEVNRDNIQDCDFEACKNICKNILNQYWFIDTILIQGEYDDNGLVNIVYICYFKEIEGDNCLVFKEHIVDGLYNPIYVNYCLNLLKEKKEIESLKKINIEPHFCDGSTNYRRRWNHRLGVR